MSRMESRGGSQQQQQQLPSNFRPSATNPVRNTKVDDGMADNGVRAENASMQAAAGQTGEGTNKSNHPRPSTSHALPTEEQPQQQSDTELLMKAAMTQRAARSRTSQSSSDEIMEFTTATADKPANGNNKRRRAGNDAHLVHIPSKTVSQRLEYRAAANDESGTTSVVSSSLNEMKQSMNGGNEQKRRKVGSDFYARVGASLYQNNYCTIPAGKARYYVDKMEQYLKRMTAASNESHNRQAGSSSNVKRTSNLNSSVKAVPVAIDTRGGDLSPCDLKRVVTSSSASTVGEEELAHGNCIASPTVGRKLEKVAATTTIAAAAARGDSETKREPASNKTTNTVSASQSENKRGKRKYTKQQPRPGGKDPKPYNRYNIYYVLERELYLQDRGVYKPTQCSSGTTIVNYTGLVIPPLPARYAKLKLEPEWYINKTKKKRLHSYSHGVIGFRDMATMFAAKWKTEDDDIIEFFSTVSARVREWHDQYFATTNYRNRRRSGEEMNQPAEPVVSIPSDQSPTSQPQPVIGANPRANPRVTIAPATSMLDESTNIGCKSWTNGDGSGLAYDAGVYANHHLEVKQESQMPAEKIEDSQQVIRASHHFGGTQNTVAANNKRNNSNTDAGSALHTASSGGWGNAVNSRAMEIHAGKTELHKKEQYPKPYNRCNLYFIVERELLFQERGVHKPNRGSTDIVHSDIVIPPLPPRYANLILQPEWYMNKGKKLKHVNGFRDIVAMFATKWKTEDDDIIEFFTTVAERVREGHIRYLANEATPLIQGSGGGAVRSYAGNTTDQGWIHVNPYQHQMMVNIRQGQLSGGLLPNKQHHQAVGNNANGAKFEYHATTKQLANNRPHHTGCNNGSKLEHALSEGQKARGAEHLPSNDEERKKATFSERDMATQQLIHEKVKKKLREALLRKAAHGQANGQMAMPETVSSVNSEEDSDDEMGALIYETSHTAKRRAGKDDMTKNFYSSK